MNNKAFTLIEVLVVVLIIGILTSIAVPQYQRAVLKSRLSQAMTIAGIIRDAEHVYYSTYNTYTADLNELDITPLSGCQTISSIVFPGRTTVTYNCDSGWQIVFIHNGAAHNSVKVFVPPQYGLAVEYYSQNDTRLCYVPSAKEQYIAVCKSMGATPYGTYSDYYQFP